MSNETNDYEKIKKSEIKKNILELEENINTVLAGFDIKDIEAKPDMMSKLEMSNIELYDYNKELEIIKIDAKETLNCLANLYLNEEKMENKNISIIIKEHSKWLTNLNFSVSCSKRALISCMNKLDMGVTDAELYISVSAFQKEMRETVKATQEVYGKLKEFYKNLKGELDEINTGPEQEKDQLKITKNTKIVDINSLNDVLEEFKKDNMLLNMNKENDDNIKKRKLKQSNNEKGDD